MTWQRLQELGRGESLDGATDGMLVVPTMGRLRTPFVKAMSRFYMPWLGKRFFAAEGRGDNRFKPSVRAPAKLLWPGYATRPNGGERTVFDFVTRTEAGGHDPDTQVLVIDYAPVEENPDRLIRRIRDEIVEVDSGIFLGKILYRENGGEYSNLGFFALRGQ